VDSDRFEVYMRQFAYYHSLRLLPETWTVLRVDGRGFSRLTASAFAKPFDARFHDLMARTATAPLKGRGYDVELPTTCQVLIAPPSVPATNN